MSRAPLPSEEIAKLRAQNAALLGLLRRVQRCLRIPGDHIDEAMRELADWCLGREDAQRGGER